MKRLLAVIMTLCMVLGVSSISAWATDSWTTKANMPTSRGSFQCVTINGIAYMIGGANGGGKIATIEAYDSLTNTWSAKANIPTPRMRLGVATVNSKIYAIGGNSGGLTSSNTVEEYDPATNTWTTKASITTAREAFGAATVDGKIYVIGGAYCSSGYASVYLNTVEMYDPDTNSWTAKANMPTARRCHGVAAVNNKIYAIGGQNSSGSYVNTVEEYDPATNTWTTKASMTTAREEAGIAALNGKIYAMGGISTSYLSTLEEYDPVADTWTTRASMSVARDGFGATAANGKIYSFGGYIPPGNATNSVEEYDPPVSVPNAPQGLVATAGASKVDLTWGAASNATSYTVKRATTTGGPYTAIAENQTNTSYLDTNVTNGTTYYYVVTVANSAGTSTNSNEASATPQAPATAGKALLVITMTNGLEKEYDLSMTEVAAFINWYDSRTSGSGLGYYTINKTFNLGPFLTRVDYITYDKIQNFEVMQYQ